MWSFSSFCAAALLIALGCAVPLERRDADNPSIVQGLLGTDGFWNDYDGGTNAYIQYTGSGSKSDGWPGVEAWVSFNEMWITNAHLIARSCNLWYGQPNMNAEETSDLYDAIKQVAHETRVDHRFIFAVIMEETRGCVRANTTTLDDVANTGLLQAYKGSNTCNGNGKVLTPCPTENILGQVRDGVAGSVEGHGLATDINVQSKVVNNEIAYAYYRASRLYISGAIDASGDLEKGEGDHCYSSDIANRLMGFTDAQYTCTLNK